MFWIDYCISIKNLKGEFKMGNINILEKFGNLVKEKPNDVMIYDDREYSYCEIDTLSSELASKIKFKYDEKIRIGISLDHTYKIIVTILAVLKSGNSYVPINKKILKNGINDIINTSNIKLIIEDSDNSYENIDVIYYSSLVGESISEFKPVNKIDDSSEVYVLYTSGSTGIPKGCSVSYGNLCYIIENMQNLCPVDHNSVYLFCTSFSFDVSVTEIYSFIYGSKIVVYDISSYSKYKNLPNLAKQYKITHFATSPSYFLSILMAYDENQKNFLFSYMKYVMIAGEEFKLKIFDLWKNSNWKFRLFNMYGPTEATVYALYYELSKDGIYGNSIPIGEALHGCKYYVEKLKEESIGELILIGKGICGGYINNEIDNKIKFSMHNNERSYRTGDYVSVKNGLVMFHGRKDEQLQLNGIRVEIGEIEHKIRDIENVNDVAVVYYNNMLISNIVLKEKCSKKSFYSLLDANLPKYMIPNYFVFVDELRKNQSNKVDRKYIINKYLIDTKSEESTNSIELDDDIISFDKFIKFFKNQLNIQSTQYNIDIFELGANSLDIFNIASAIEKEYNINVDVDIFYVERTINNIYNSLNKNFKVDECKIKCNESTLEKSNIISLVDKFSELNSQIINYMYNEESLIEIYEGIHLQSGYIKEKFNSYVSFNFNIGNSYTLEKVQTALKDLIKKNSILRSKILIKDESIFIEEYDLLSDIPFVDVTDYSFMDFDEIEDYIVKSYSDFIFKCRYNRGYLALFVIVKNKDNINVIFIIDHCISDASNIKIIKDKLVSSLEGRLEWTPENYREFCRQVKLNNSIEKLLNSDYVNDISKCRVKDYKNVVNSLQDKTSIMKISNFTSNDSVYISIIQAYIAGKETLNEICKESIAIRTILNIRDFNDYSFKDTIGDIHVGMSFVLNKEDDYIRFENNSKKIIELFTNNHFRPSYVTYFNKDKRLDEVKKIFKESVFLATNYLGIVMPNEVDEMIDKIIKDQQKMYEITKYIFITSFSSNDVLYIICNKNIFKESQQISLNSVLC